MRHLEDGLQQAVAAYLDLRRLLWCHCPNGGKRNAREAARLMGMGVKPGVPDVLIFHRWRFAGEQAAGHRRSGFGVAIELKSPKGRTTPAQEEWISALRGKGLRVFVCRTLDEVIAACEVVW